VPASSWNDLRYVLAVSRGRTLGAAAKLLGVDDTTIARRLAALQQAMGVQLCYRLANGRLQLTPAGETAALRAEAMEREFGLLQAEISGADSGVSGTVRLTSVPIVVNRVLVPGAGLLLRRHPALQLELIADPRDFSLTHREADVALRLARPKTGGTRTKARRVGTLHYAAYASASCSVREASSMPWITYEEAMAHLPQARWMAAAIRRGRGAVGQLRVHDAETALEVVIAGLGRSLLPRLVGDGDTRLRRMDERKAEPVVTRELWLLTHAELAGLGRIAAVADWIAALLPRRSTWASHP
jgi:DNA-binding transcriptional LysR family regulator